MVADIAHMSAMFSLSPALLCSCSYRQATVGDVDDAVYIWWRILELQITYNSYGMY
jgi:hypothetical protein